MLRHPFDVVVFCLAMTQAVSTSCDAITPLQLPIKDIQVMPDIADSFMRGVAAMVGSPEQDIVLLPWPELNNTWLYDQNAFCDSTVIFDDTICQVRRGNYFREDQSTSYAKTSDLVASGGAPVETQGKGAELGIQKLLTTSLAGSYNFTIEPASTLERFPIGTPRLAWDHGYTILHAMGMGRNSTFLNTLFTNRQISSRVWSFFWGRTWVDSQDAVDGSLVLGGYNQEQVFGDNLTQRLDYSDTTGCWTGMKVHVSSLNLNFRNGTDFSLLPTNTALDMCLVPQRQLLTEAPATVISAFEGATGMTTIGPSYGIHWSAALYDNVNVFDGDMTFGFSSGFQVRVPNSQFLVPFVTIDRNGSQIFNTSQRELLINGVADQPATLGRYFFTAAYLMVDHDAGTFTMWQANPSGGSTLVPVMSTEASEQCKTGKIDGTNTTSSEDPSGTGAATQSSSLSIGAIVGVAVGGVAALVMVVAVAWCFRRRRRQANQAPAEQRDGTTTHDNADKFEDNGHNREFGYSHAPMYAGHSHDHSTRHELHHPQLRSELDGDQETITDGSQRVYEMDGSYRG